MFANLPHPATLARLHDLANVEATRLRHEAADDFWRGTNAVWQRSLQTGQALAERSAARLQARLARHVRGRTASAPIANPRTHSGV